MANTNQLVEQLKQAQQNYDDAYGTPAEREHGMKVKSVKKDISAAIADGAEPCPDCKNAPMGIEKRAATDNSPAQFEVGCVNCADHRARGWSPEDAVKRWNSMEWVGSQPKQEEM